jgi:hypothetical protein
LKWRHKIDYDDPFRQSHISDADLDELIAGIQEGHPERGERMVMAYLKRYGVNVPRAVMRASIHRVNPEGVAYRAHIATPRIEYSVPKPHHLWHVDGNHKLVEFGIAIEGGIDGHTRMCLFLKAVTKYNADIVLDMFKEAVSIYTVPSRMCTCPVTNSPVNSLLYSLKTIPLFSLTICPPSFSYYFLLCPSELSSVESF